MIKDPDGKDEIYLANVAKLGSSAKNVYVIDNFLPNEEYQILSNLVNSDQIDWMKEPWSTERNRRDSLPEDCLELFNKIYLTSRLNCMNYYKIEVNNAPDEHVVRKWSKGSKMQPHVDVDAQKHIHIVCMYYLNDDYDGGEIFFPDYDLKIKPKSNSLIMFPGNENYVHGVLEVSKGFRYTYQVTFAFSGSTFLGPTGLHARMKYD
jgi:hypothetical protein